MDAPRLTLHDADAELPVWHGRLFDFPDDPMACMRRLQSKFGDIAAMEEEGQRIYFIFSPNTTTRSSATARRSIPASSRSAGRAIPRSVA
jgi:hypothetical protein